MQNEETLAAIKEELDVIKEELIKSNKVIMKKLNSLYEYNEINDMRARVFNEQLNYIKNKIER